MDVLPDESRFLGLQWGVMVCRWFTGDTVSDLFKIQGRAEQFVNNFNNQLIIFSRKIPSFLPSVRIFTVNRTELWLLDKTKPLKTPPWTAATDYRRITSSSRQGLDNISWIFMNNSSRSWKTSSKQTQSNRLQWLSAAALCLFTPPSVLHSLTDTTVLVINLFYRCFNKGAFNSWQ